MAFIIKQHDTRPVFRAQLLQPDPNNTLVNIPVDLSSVTGVRFIMSRGTTVKVNAAATIENAAEGRILYTWVAADTDSPGEWNAEIEVSWGADKQTFPSDSYMRISIKKDLA